MIMRRGSTSIAAAAPQQQLSSMVGNLKLRGRGDEISDLMLKLGCHDNMFGHTNEEENNEKVTAIRSSRVATDSTVRLNCITGVTGSGKTTLVQTLLQDQNVRKHFDHHIYWVSVSGSLDDKKRLADEILKAMELAVPPYYEWDPLRSHLRGCIEKKKFLLILDDVREDVDNVTWDQELKPCLDAAAPGSKILVTTKYRNVAEKMVSSSEDVIHLGQLSVDDSWLLLCDIALQSRTEDQIRDFERVGRQLAEGCLGVPFAINTLGCTLSHKGTIQEWEAELESGYWTRNSEEEELKAPPLLTSNDPSTADLRGFFKFCGFLPYDYEVDKVVLIKLWMTAKQRFLDGKDGDQMEMEMKGEEYFDTLVMLSFLQGYERGGVDDQKKRRYKFYSPLHALAKSEAGKESRCIEEDRTSPCPAVLKCSRKTLHLTLIFKDDNVDSIPPTVYQENKLQVLKFVKSSRRWNPLMIPPDVFRQFIHLRALDMSYTGLHDLSPEIDKLTQLRYLNLSGSKFSTLPDTVCNLEYLETLILNDCEELTRLPQKMGNLTKSRHIELQNTPKLLYFPEGFGRLTDLRTLTKFVIASSSSNGAKIEELKDLNLLEGHLEIRGLKRVKSGSDALKAELVRKTHLQSLCLDFDCDQEQTPEAIKVMEIVLEALGPFPKMRKNVEVRNYLGSKALVSA